jgi:hypothetical protein
MILLGLGLITGGGFILYRFVRPLPDVWRGRRSTVPGLSMLDSTPRTYITVALVCGAGGMAFLLLGCVTVVYATTSATLDGGVLLVVALISVVLLMSALVMVPLNWIVQLFAWPRLLIPPPYRAIPGSLAKGQERRRRRNAGEPETDHLVEIFELAPDKDGVRGLVGLCNDDECGWMEFADKGVAGTSEEAQIRAKAGRHSTNIAAGVRRPDYK